MVRWGEIGVTVTLLLLDEHMERLQLLLHVFNSFPDKLINADNIMLACSHLVLLTCNHGLELKIVIQMFSAALIAQWGRMCAAIHSYLFVMCRAEHVGVCHGWRLHRVDLGFSYWQPWHDWLGGRWLLIMSHTAAAANTSETGTWLATTTTLAKIVRDLMMLGTCTCSIAWLEGGKSNVMLSATLFIIVGVHLKSLKL